MVSRDDKYFTTQQYIVVRNEEVQHMQIMIFFFPLFSFLYYCTAFYFLIYEKEIVARGVSFYNKKKGRLKLKRS